MATPPKDVRTAAYTLMQRHLTEPFADDEERRLVLRQADDACELLAAWLDAQPVAPAPEPTERWEPVEGYVQYEGASVDLEVDGAELHMYHDSGVDLVTILPDNVRLCRRVEVTP